VNSENEEDELLKSMPKIQEEQTPHAADINRDIA
jgi:hypothetical protein